MGWQPLPPLISEDGSGEIGALTEKVTPVDADLVLIEDSAAAGAYKYVQVVNLPGGGVRDGWTLVESASQADFDDTTDAGAILAVYRWGVDGSANPYFDSAGVTAGEEAALWLNADDNYALVELEL